ncbi:hypothetical protein [Acaryochloris marina]|uniref:hypothetical protein n=1 Tax=Acaryochloris marina TaxID=155978 RepID=UPI001BB04C04|nr:hypothetical protein [Acaryochloris marina]QUY41114.1 hypothetical protein I1H34_17695 [Acaryochloris marina S15]
MPINPFAAAVIRGWLQQTQSANRRGVQAGFALPLALGLGFVMVVLGLTMLMTAQSDRITSWQRKESGASLSTAEGGMARTLAQLTNPNNAILLNRNYDTINIKTGKTYLGADGSFNSGDEETALIDEWTSYNPSNEPCHQQMNWGVPNFQFSGSIGDNGTYSLKAYRYDPKQQQGTLFVEATTNGQATGIIITINVTPDLDNFPGIIASRNTNGAVKTGTLALRGREVLGSKGNIYYNPDGSANSSLTNSAAPEDASRADYLDAIWSTDGEDFDADGSPIDTVEGKIFACNLPPKLPTTIQGTNFGRITTSTTLKGVGSMTPTLYHVESIDLDNDEVLTIDTTGGPVQIDVIYGGTDPELAITLRDNAKILNIRTDDQLPQVGDLRILARGNSQVNLFDRSCIQNAFLWFPIDDLRLLTTGPGCPGGRNTNVEGVLWMEAILALKSKKCPPPNDQNNLYHRDVNFLNGFNGTNYDENPECPYQRITSGIAVPEDVSSLMDLLKYVEWPARYRFGGVKNWQRVRL